MLRQRANLDRDITTLRATLVAVLGLAFGIVLLWVSNYLDPHPDWQAIIRSLGGLFVATITLKTLWDLAAKRSFLAELMAMTQLAEDVKTAGIVGIISDFYRGFDWPRTFAKTYEFDLLFAYGQTWRRTNRIDLQALAQKKNIKVRIILPDPNNADVVGELARRFSTTPDKLKHEIEEACNEFKKIFENSLAKFGLFYMPLAPVYSWYRFDDLAVVAFYKHGKERKNVPTLLVEQGGTMYDFMRDEFETLVTTLGKTSVS